MDPRDLSAPPWMTSAIEQLEAARPWTAQLKSVEDNAAKVTGLNAKGSTAVKGADSIYGSIPNTRKTVTASVPDVASVIHGFVPNVSEVITGSIPDAASIVQGCIPGVMPLDTGTAPAWQQASAKKLPGDFTGLTSGLSLEDARSASSALASLGVLRDTPVSGAMFLSGAGLVEAVTGAGQPVVSRRRKRQGLVVTPKSLYRPLPGENESAEDEQDPQVLPQELGEELAQDLTRRHRQEVKGLLVALGLDLGLEHLEAIERRLRDGGRPDRLHAALSASLLLEEVANRLYPPRPDRKSWTCRFKNSHELGAPHVKSRLHAFAHPFLEQRSTAEHKLFVAELDLVARWMGKGHHVVFTKSENEEAFIALLKVLAIVARAHRHTA